MKKVIHSGRGKPKICHLIQGETYTMSDVRIGLTFFKKRIQSPKPRARKKIKVYLMLKIF